MYCDYGCGKEAKFQLKNGKNCCSKRPSGCSVLKKINSDSTKLVYKTGKRKSGSDAYRDLPDDSKKKMAWNKDVFPKTVFEYNGTGNHKQFLIQERGHQCEECNLTEWNHQPIPLELEHTDGDNRNNIKSNLKLLCCNCHALTPTWRGRNINTGKVKVDDEKLLTALTESANIRQALQKVGLTPKGGNYVRAKKLRARGETGHTQET